MSRRRQSWKARGERPGHRESYQREDHEPREVDRDRDAEKRSESKCVCRSVSFHCVHSKIVTTKSGTDFGKFCSDIIHSIGVLLLIDSLQNSFVNPSKQRACLGKKQV